MRVRFLDLNEVLQIHASQLEAFGGSPGIRDLGALESAMAMPAAGMGVEFFHKSLHEMAAAYLYHLCQNHPFVDGNKRVALAASRYFLHVNGAGFAGETESLYQLTMDTASGRMKKTDVAKAFEKLAGKKPKGNQ